MVDMNSISQEDFNKAMDNASRMAVLDGLKTDPIFKKQFIELLNKKNDSDKDIFVDILQPAKEVDDDKMKYTIVTGKKKSEFSFTSLGELSISRRLLRSLYELLTKMDKEGTLK